MKSRHIFFAILSSLTLSALLLSCSSDAEVDGKGQAGVKVTDAAVDAQSITGVFLSVTEVQAHANGEARTIAVFETPRVFNLMDYQNGDTYSLGEGELNAGIYNELRLITDTDSYVSFEDGTTQPLEVPSGSSSGYKIKGDYQISANNKTNLVVDVDLRKAFVRTGNNTYKLRPTARLINEDNTGTIRGTTTINEDRVVIYAYAKGTYTESEADEPAEGETRFENSINSAVVSNGQFKLAFMEPGEYDLIAAAYEYNSEEDVFTFRAAAQAEIMLNGSLLNVIKLEAKSSVNVVVNVDSF